MRNNKAKKIVIFLKQKRWLKFFSELYFCKLRYIILGDVIKWSVLIERSLPKEGCLEGKLTFIARLCPFAVGVSSALETNKGDPAHTFISQGHLHLRTGVTCRPIEHTWQGTWTGVKRHSTTLLAPREHEGGDASVKWDNSHESDPGIKILSGGSAAIFGEEESQSPSDQDPWLALPVALRSLRVGGDSAIKTDVNIFFSWLESLRWLSCRPSLPRAFLFA